MGLVKVPAYGASSRVPRSSPRAKGASTTSVRVTKLSVSSVRLMASSASGRVGRGGRHEANAADAELGDPDTGRGGALGPGGRARHAAAGAVRGHLHQAHAQSRS